MRRLIIVLIAIMLGRVVHSQTKFFIAPVVNQKIYISAASHIDNNGLFYNPTLLSDNPYFDLNLKQFSTRQDIPMGLNIGLSIRDEKHILCFGYSQDGVGTSMEYSALTKGPSYPDDPNTPVYHSFVGSMNSMHYINRLTLKYSFCLNHNLKHNNNFYVNAGFSILYGKPRIGIEHYEYEPPIELLYNNAKVTEFSTTTGYKGVGSLMIGVGIAKDFGFKCKSNHKYLFTLGVNYMHGFRTIQGDVVDFLVNDNGSIFHLHYEAQSRGSGIYFELSRRFQLYPWKKRNKT